MARRYRHLRLKQLIHFSSTPPDGSMGKYTLSSYELALLASRPVRYLFGFRQTLLRAHVYIQQFSVEFILPKVTLFFASVPTFQQPFSP